MFERIIVETRFLKSGVSPYVLLGIKDHGPSQLL